MRAFDAVLFDWSGTLVHDPHPRDRIRPALTTLKRDDSPEAVAAIVDALEISRGIPEVERALRDEDTSAERHRVSNLMWFAHAGIDDELAHALYDFDHEIDNRPLYLDAAATLAALHALGVKVGVVSDIHLDLRVMLAAQAVGDFIDAYVLSFEHGWQKPDPRMFRAALELLGVPPERTLMVGDRASHDGGAVEVGIATYILPPPPEINAVRGLDAVTRLVAPPG